MVRTAIERAAENVWLRGLAHWMAIISPLVVSGIAAVLWTMQTDIDTLARNQAVIGERLKWQEQASAANASRIGALESLGSDLKSEIAGVTALLRSIDQRLARQEARWDRADGARAR